MLDLDFGPPVSFGIRRCEFDHYLLSRCGARLQLGEAAWSIARDGDAWVVDDRYRTSMLVGAGGHFCPVAQWLGQGAQHGPLRARCGSLDPASARRESLVAAQEMEFLLDESQQAECRVEGRRPELYFCRDLAGYGWCFRKGDYLNVGLGREDRERLPEHVAAFCEYLQDQGRIPRRLPGKFRGHAYLLYGHASRDPVGDGVLLVGDAAGLAYAESGEGIRPAIESGLMAAEVILAAAGDYGRERLEPYRASLTSRFGERSSFRPPAGGWSSRLRQFLAGRLLANRWFVRRVVLERWFLHTGQASLGIGG